MQELHFPSRVLLTPSVLNFLPSTSIALKTKKEEEEGTDFDDFDGFNDVTAIINKFPVLDC